MQQFIPFEDDLDALENLRTEDMIPYRDGLLDNSAALNRRSAPVAPAIPGPQAGPNGSVLAPDAARTRLIPAIASPGSDCACG